MKRLLIILSVFICLSAYAQERHMSFMGIPLVGSIDTFDKKFEAKGFVPDETLNEIYEFDGVRIYSGGKFCGYSAQLFVYYTPGTKNVYRAKAVLAHPSEDVTKLRYSEIIGLLQQKYSHYRDNTGTNYGYDEYIMGVFNNESDDSNSYYGTIDLYMYHNTMSTPFVYSLNVDYIDCDGKAKDDSAKMDDL